MTGVIPRSFSAILVLCVHAPDSYVEHSFGLVLTRSQARVLLGWRPTCTVLDPTTLLSARPSAGLQNRTVATPHSHPRCLYWYMPYFDLYAHLPHQYLQTLARSISLPRDPVCTFTLPSPAFLLILLVALAAKDPWMRS